MLRRKTIQPISFELSESVRRFLSDYESGSLRTKQSYEGNLAAFLCFAEKRSVTHMDQIDAQLLREYIADQKEYTYFRLRSKTAQPLTLATLRLRQGVVRTWLKWAERQGHIQESPMGLVRPVTGEVRARHAFSPEEVRKLVLESGKANGWLGYRDRAIVLVLLGTGARADELLHLTPYHFEWKSSAGTGGKRGDWNRVLLNGKGSRDRRAMLGEKAGPAVRDYLQHRPEWISREPLDAMWWTFRKEPMAYSALNAMLKNLGKYAGVADVTPHRFRHTFAVSFYRSSKDIMALKTRLGHSKIETTQRYLHSLGVEYGAGDEYQSPDELF